MRAEHQQEGTEYTWTWADGRELWFNTRGKLAQHPPAQRRGRPPALRRPGPARAGDRPAGRRLQLHYLDPASARYGDRFSGVQSIDTPVGRFDYEYGSALPEGSSVPPRQAPRQSRQGALPDARRSRRTACRRSTRPSARTGALRAGAPSRQTLSSRRPPPRWLTTRRRSRTSPASAAATTTKTRAFRRCSPASASKAAAATASAARAAEHLGLRRAAARHPQRAGERPAQGGGTKPGVQGSGRRASHASSGCRRGRAWARPCSPTASASRPPTPTPHRRPAAPGASARPGCASCGPGNMRYGYDRLGRLTEQTTLDASGRAAADPAHRARPLGPPRAGQHHRLARGPPASPAMASALRIRALRRTHRAAQPATRADRAAQRHRRTGAPPALQLQPPRPGDRSHRDRLQPDRRAGSPGPARPTDPPHHALHLRRDPTAAACWRASTGRCPTAPRATRATPTSPASSGMRAASTSWPCSVPAGGALHSRSMRPVAGRRLC